VKNLKNRPRKKDDKKKGDGDKKKGDGDKKKVEGKKKTEPSDEDSEPAEVKKSKKSTKNEEEESEPSEVKRMKKETTKKDTTKSGKKDKKKKKKDDTKAHFGIDGEPDTFSCDPAEATQEMLLEQFNMSIIKYVVSDINEVIFAKDGKFDVKPGTSYIIVGIIVGHSLCGRCNKEYDINNNDPKKTLCRHHPGEWREISIEVKEYVEDEEIDSENGEKKKKKEERKEAKSRKNCNGLVVL